MLAIQASVSHTATDEFRCYPWSSHFHGSETRPHETAMHGSPAAIQLSAAPAADLKN